jgi:uncharacterized membrane protein YedE/YeeE
VNSNLPSRAGWFSPGVLSFLASVFGLVCFPATCFDGGGYGRFDADPFVLALLARIRTLSGGFVPLRGSSPIA